MHEFLHTEKWSLSDLVRIAVSKDQPTGWRGALMLYNWLLEHPEDRDKIPLPELLKGLSKKPDGHQRELLKVLSLMTLTEEEEGQLFDLCMGIWEKTSFQPSLRYYAIRIIAQIISRHPELKKELNYLIEERYLESLSPGIRKSILKMLSSTTA